MLLADVSCFPNDLLETELDRDEALQVLSDPFDLDTYDRRWYFVYTKARQEKALARDLIKLEIPFYLPLVPRDSFSRGRRIRSYVPLFTGYVFLFSSRIERYRSLETNRIAHTVDIDDQEILQIELRQIQRLIEADAPLSIERRMTVGQRVRVKSGPLCGIEGTLLRVGNAPKLLVSVQYLGQGVTLEIEGFKVEPIY